MFLYQLHRGSVFEDREIEGVEIREKFTLQGSLNPGSNSGGAMALPLGAHLFLEATGVLQEPAKCDAYTKRRDEGVALRSAAQLIERRCAHKRMVDDLADFSVHVAGTQRVVVVLALVAVPGLRESFLGLEGNNVQPQVAGAGKALDRLIRPLGFVKRKPFLCESFPFVG